MLMTRPQRRLIIPRAAYLVIRNVPFMFVSTTESQSASLNRNSRLSLVNPALLTRTSIRPKSFSTALANASTWLPTPTSQAYPRVPSPKALAACSAAPPSREQSATLAPASMKALQMSCPMPRVPPVTSATFPVRSSGTRFSLWTPGSTTAPGFVIHSRCFHEPGHLIGRSQADHVRFGYDSLQEAREHAARADLDKACAVR